MVIPIVSPTLFVTTKAGTAACNREVTHVGLVSREKVVTFVKGGGELSPNVIQVDQL
jgi:hypothetical protein